jgi:hypothetical protein
VQGADCRKGWRVALMLPGFHAPRTKQCSMCSKPFTPARPLQSVCSPRCAAKIGKVKRAKEKNAEKLRRAALETIPELKKEAQRWFNKFIRLRDRDKGCYVDAGHVRSRGSADHLRYREDNCFGECKSCNSSWGATQEQKEAGAVRRIGQERWDAVRLDNSTVKWTKDGLRELIATYKAKCRELERMEDK